jgi:tetrahydromethanopterin S-methyltransferase subunit G
MDAKTLWKKSLTKAVTSPGNMISGAVCVAASAALWNPLPLILWGLGSTGWTVFASTNKNIHKQILDEERRAEEAKIEAEREVLRQKIESQLLEPPVVHWIRRGALPDYMQVYRRLVEIRDRVARVLGERGEDSGGILQQLNYMLTAYLTFVRERVIYLQILANIRPAAAGMDESGVSFPAASATGGKTTPPPPPPAGFAQNRWERVTKPGKPQKGQAEPSPAAMPSVDTRLEEIDRKIERLRELARKEPATARTREWHVSILEKQRELLVECQKRDQTCVAQLGAFLDVFEVILGRVTATQSTATEIAGYMSSVVEQIEETERFVESLQPAMSELMGGMDPALTRWSASTSA